MAKLVSKTYGDALFELAVESNQLDSFLEEAKGVLSILESNAELNRLMNHPKIVKEEKLTTLEKIFKGRIKDELTGLLCMLVEKDHYSETTAVLEYFILQAKEYKHIGTVYVTSAVKLGEIQKSNLLEKLLKTTDYVEFEMHYDVDPSLIGGMIVRIKDRVVDSSIKSKLASLSSELSKIQLKVGECAP
ncbi:MAG: ATP synthase F1 subunit delta [Eubacterium sp.]|nr:ATP synthase F1 subunit delta [Eubacterium sp.]